MAVNGENNKLRDHLPHFNVALPMSGTIVAPNSLITGSFGELSGSRPVIMSLHGRISTACSFSIITSVSSTVVAGPFTYAAAGDFNLPYSPMGHCAGELKEGLVLSSSVASPGACLATYVIEKFRYGA